MSEAHAKPQEREGNSVEATAVAPKSEAFNNTRDMCNSPLNNLIITQLRKKTLSKDVVVARIDVLICNFDTGRMRALMANIVFASIACVL